MFLSFIISQILTPVVQSRAPQQTAHLEGQRAAALEDDAFLHHVLGDCMRQPQILTLFVSSSAWSFGPLQPSALTLILVLAPKSSFQQSDLLLPKVTLRPE